MTKINHLIALSLVAGASAFALVPLSYTRAGTHSLRTRATLLEMRSPLDKHDGEGQSRSSETKSPRLGRGGRNAVATSVVAGAYLLSNILFSDVASALATPPSSFSDSSIGGSSQVLLSGRSGGRAGGRSMGGRSGGRSSYRSAPSSARSYRPAYSTGPSSVYVAPPPVVVSPFGFGGFGYNPFGGFGLGYGIGALGGGGDSIRDYRQEREIVDGQEQLRQAKQKEMELEQRIRMLEQQQPGGGVMRSSQPVIQQQQKAGEGAAAATTTATPEQANK